MNYLMNDNGDMFEFSAHKMPVFKEQKDKDYIIWGYENSMDVTDRQWNNKQPDYYEWLYNSSSKHRAIINRKVLFICGKGLDVRDKSLNKIQTVEAKAYAIGLNQSDFIKNISLNLLKTGGFCYEVITDKKGKKIEPHYINIKNVRRSKVEYDADGRKVPPTYFYTCDWNNKPQDNPDYTVFEEWKWDKDAKPGTRYLVYYNEDQENLYPIPEYTAAVPYIASDYEIGNFVYNNIRNGFSAGWLVNFHNGDPSPEDKAKISEYFKARLHGTDNAGEPVLAFNDIGVDGVNIQSLQPNGQDDRFINLNKQVREEIFSGHTIDPVVVGLSGNNGFNNNADEKRTAIEDFQAYYVSGKQMLIEQHINAIRMYNDIKGNLEIVRLDPIESAVTESELALILTEDERRERAGYEPKTEEQKTTEVTTTVKEIERGFKSDEDNQIIYELSKSGIWNEELEVICERELFAKDIEDAEIQGQEFLNALEVLVLNAIGDNPNIEAEQLAESLQRDVSEIQDVLNRLLEQGLINEDGGVTPEGEAEQDEIFTVYKYAKRSDVSGADVIDTTRDFCRNLVTLSKIKSWTIDDIKRMNNGMNLDVFRSRGGWRTLPNGSHVPFCRHVWKAQIVRRKKQ